MRKGPFLITGASRGIGAETAKLIAADGHPVIINYRIEQKAAQLVSASIQESGGTASVIQADVSDEKQTLAMFEEIDSQYGSFAGLINNAGIVAPASRLEDCSLERIEKLFKVNVIGSFLCAREAVKRMSTKKGGEGGVIVNVSSISAVLGSASQYVDYAATKGAIDVMTIGLAREVASEGIRVTCVRPGITDTEIHASGGDPDRAERLGPSIPMQRAGKAKEIANVIAWLASDKASYCTGSIIDVAGGK